MVMGTLQHYFGRRIYITKQISGYFQAKWGGQIKVGVRGQADLGGWFMAADKVFAIPFQIEIKSGKGSQSGDQVAFQNMCEGTGCMYQLVRFEDEDDYLATSRPVTLLLNRMKTLGGYDA